MFVYSEDTVDSARYFQAIPSAARRYNYVPTVGYAFGESWTNDNMLADRALFRPSCLA